MHLHFHELVELVHQQLPWWWQWCQGQVLLLHKYRSGKRQDLGHLHATSAWSIRAKESKVKVHPFHAIHSIQVQPCTWHTWNTEIRTCEQSELQLVEYLCECLEMSIKHDPVGNWYPISFMMVLANDSIRWGVPPMQTNLTSPNIALRSWAPVLNPIW